MSGVEPILSVEGVSKRFANRLPSALRYGMRDMARAMVLGTPPAYLRPSESWVLEDIGFELRPGEALGILGGNGSGKTTLLKLIYGILKPDRGSIRRRGSVYGLIELGSGLDPRLNGLENIALWTMTSGAGRPARARMRDDAVAFCELGGGLEKPVQSYSAGMKARLAFAMAASARADLLLIDEALAVGDLGFQIKCMRYLADYVAGGGALLLTSHGVHIDRLSTRALHLSEGRGTLWDNASNAVAMHEQNQKAANPTGLGESAQGDGIQITKLEASGPEGSPLRTGSPIEIRLSYRSEQARAAGWYFFIHAADSGVCILGDAQVADVALREGDGELSCRLAALPLLPGAYYVRAGILDDQLAFALCAAGGGGGVRFEVVPPLDRTLRAAENLDNRQLIDVTAERWRSV